jgi:hypothetical protein
MTEEFNKIRKDIFEYLEVRLNQISLHTAENLSRILTNTANIVIIGYLLFFILLFISMAAGYFFSEVFGSNQLGFLSIAGFYILILIVFLIFRRKIVERPIIQTMVKLFFTKFTDDEK